MKILIVYYSLYGHVFKLAQAVKESLAVDWLRSTAAAPIARNVAIWRAFAFSAQTYHGSWATGQIVSVEKRVCKCRKEW